MRADSNYGCANVLFSVKKVIADVINKNVKQRVTPSAGRIPKGLQRHESSEGWVKKLYNAGDQVLHNLNLVQHKVNSISVMVPTFLPNRGYFVNSINRTVVCKKTLNSSFNGVCLV